MTKIIDKIKYKTDKPTVVTQDWVNLEIFMSDIRLVRNIMCTAAKVAFVYNEIRLSW